MKRLLLTGLAIFFAFSACFAQIPIATQGFEPDDTWLYSSYPDFYTQGSDIFNINVGDYSGQSPAEGNSFLLLRDLTAAGTIFQNDMYYHYITFDPISIPTPHPSDLKLSFKYYIGGNGYDGSDFMTYQILFDENVEWSSGWSQQGVNSSTNGSLIDTSADFTAHLPKDVTDGWVTHTLELPDTTSLVRLRIGSIENADLAGLDDFSLFFDAGDFVAPNCIASSVYSSNEIILEFDEKILQPTISVEGYSVQDITLSNDSTQATLTLSSSLIDGDYFMVNIESFQDNAGNINSQQINDLVFNSYTGDLVITEINYNDPGQWDNLDFLEVYNNGSSIIPLGGLNFDTGINFSLS